MHTGDSAQGRSQFAVYVKGCARHVFVLNWALGVEMARLNIGCRARIKGAQIQAAISWKYPWKVS